MGRGRVADAGPKDAAEIGGGDRSGFGDLGDNEPLELLAAGAIPFDPPTPAALGRLIATSRAAKVLGAVDAHRLGSAPRADAGARRKGRQLPRRLLHHRLGSNDRRVGGGRRVRPKHSCSDPAHRHFQATLLILATSLRRPLQLRTSARSVRSAMWGHGFSPRLRPPGVALTTHLFGSRSQ